MKISKLIIAAIVLIAVVLIGGFVAYYYYYMAPTQPSGPITIGISTPLSPPGFYAGGYDIVNSAQIAVDEINANGGVLGRQLKIATYDDSGIPEKGAAAVRSLVEANDVIFIMGMIHSSVYQAGNVVAEDLGVGYMSTYATSDDNFKSNYRTSFGTVPIVSTISRGQMEYINYTGAKKVALLQEDTDFGIITAETMATEGAKYGITQKVWVFAKASTDFTAILSDVKAWGPDMIVVATDGVPETLITIQAYDAQLFPAIPLMCIADTPSTQEYWNAAQQKGLYQIYIAFFHPKMKISAQGVEFAKKFNATYHKEAWYVCYNAYDQVYLIKAAIEKAGKAERSAVVEAMRTINYTGIWGTITFPEEAGTAIWHVWPTPLLMCQVTQVNQAAADIPILWPLDQATAEYAHP